MGNWYKLKTTSLYVALSSNDSNMERIGPLLFKYRKIKRIKSSCIFCIVPFDKFIVIVLYVVIILIFKQNIVYL